MPEDNIEEDIEEVQENSTASPFLILMLSISAVCNISAVIVGLIIRSRS
jgi:hypothetical protein